MTYFGFLIIFLLIPIMILLAVVTFDRRKSVDDPSLEGLKPTGYSFLLIAIISLTYTTLWDNFLVATQVWWYDPDLVFGITLGWVPLEEYLFFILQPVLVGLWMLVFLSRVIYLRQTASSQRNLRRLSIISASLIWIASLVLLFAGGSAANYLGLELVWALPAIIFQLAFGADIIWRQWRLIFLAVVPMTLYLSLADAIAIGSGIWTISPAKSTGILLGGVLPLEEFVFFLLTNTLVAFGFVLFWSPESYARAKGILSKIRSESQEGKLQQEL
jgi:lycopene cyclase domain-containing protein